MPKEVTNFDHNCFFPQHGNIFTRTSSWNYMLLVACHHLTAMFGLLHQREGQGGLEVCPGREASTDFAAGNDWTPVVPRNDAITINIGDLLMRWHA